MNMVPTTASSPEQIFYFCQMSSDNVLFPFWYCFGVSSAVLVVLMTKKLLYTTIDLHKYY